ncbi:VOC family protein [Tessaracoccus terricola]
MASSKKRSLALPKIVVPVAVVLLVVAGIVWSTVAASSNGPAAAALPDQTEMGAVELVTADLAPMRTFYVDAVGLDVLSEDAQQLGLGSDGEVLLEVTLDPERVADSPTTAGLHHTAIPYPDERSLANVLLDVAIAAPTSYSGSADHAVSLAFYFVDPDGNGLELYVDTPAEDWVWEDGLVQMGSTFLDPNQFIRAHADDAENSPATMGHVHLRVGDLEQARAFYADTLGFAVTAESEGALFHAAGGYHHHVATNTWGSAGAGARPDSLGLGSLTVHVGDTTALQGVADRLRSAELQFSDSEGVLTVDDPWGNTVRLLA